MDTCHDKGAKVVPLARSDPYLIIMITLFKIYLDI
jgi:hypothetical protein